MAAVFLNPPSCRLKPFSCDLLSHGPCYQLSLTSNIHPFLVPLAVASVAPGPQEPTPTQAGLWEGTSLGPATQTCTVHSLIQLTFSRLDFCNKYHFLTLIYIQSKANSWLPSNCSYRRPTFNTQLRVDAALMSHLFLAATLNSFSTGLGMSFTAQCFFLAFHRSASSFFCRFSSPYYPMSVSSLRITQGLCLLSVLPNVWLRYLSLFQISYNFSIFHGLPLPTPDSHFLGKAFPHAPPHCDCPCSSVPL